MSIPRPLLLGLSFFLLWLSVSTLPAQAGFGITPPYVRNDSLTRSSEYKQRIVLTRSDPVEDLAADVTVNVPGANDWFEIDKGTRFILPKGENQVPITVTVRVPDKAKFGDYTGNIRVVLAPEGGLTAGTVGISLGAQIDVALAVADKRIEDFKIRSVKLEDAEEGRRWLGFFFPGKIRFVMQVENIGNVPYGPEKVMLKIYDAAGIQLLETTENLNRIARPNPFEVRDVVAELPTRLPPGTYKAVFRIFKGSEVTREGEFSLGILTTGSIKGYSGFGFSGLKRSEQILMASEGAGLLVLLLLVVWITRRLLKRRAHAH